jgi:hypothetical protein
VVSDCSSQAVLPVTVDGAMQLMQGMFQNVELNLSKVANGPQQVPKRSTIQNTRNSAVTGLIMQVKADALTGSFEFRSWRLGLSLWQMHRLTPRRYRH